MIVRAVSCMEKSCRKMVILLITLKAAFDVRKGDFIAHGVMWIITLLREGYLMRTK